MTELEAPDWGYSMIGGRMTVPGRSEVIGHMMFRCLDCGTEWSAVGDEAGSCPICPPLDVRRRNVLETQLKRQAMTILYCVAMLLAFLFFAIIIILVVNI